MRAPEFWDRDGVVPTLLSPLSGVTRRLTARRVARPGVRVPVPVICCGNATVGGAGKTPLALDLLTRLLARGRHPAALTRGHGGRLMGQVDPARHDARAVGDEALLLAAVAPTYVSPDRAASARAAVVAGSDVLVMDDGLQNPTLFKDLSLLVVDGGSGFGNGRLLPAGPLRESVATAAARCQAAVVIGGNEFDVPGVPILRARLRTQRCPGRVLAFAGIGRPEKFFEGLCEAGTEVVETAPFADHHAYSARELARLTVRAAELQARLVTTAKDFARLPFAFRIQVGVAAAALVWEDPTAIEGLLDRWT